MKIIADVNIPFVKKCFSSIGDMEVFGGREINREIVAEADVLLVRSITPVFADLLTGTKVRFVATATIGFDHIDVGFLRHNHIGFASAPGTIISVSHRLPARMRIPPQNMSLPDCSKSGKNTGFLSKVNQSA